MPAVAAKYAAGWDLPPWPNSHFQTLRMPRFANMPGSYRFSNYLEATFAFSRTTFQSTSICRSSPDLRMQRVPFKVSAKNDEVTSCNAPSGEQLRTYVLPFIQAYPGQPVAAVAAATVDLAALAGDGCCAHAVASMCSPGLSLVA